MNKEAVELQRSLILYAKGYGKVDSSANSAMANVKQTTLTGYQLERLKLIYQAALESPFWRRKIGSVGRIRRLEDIERIPITCRNEIDEITFSGRFHELIAGNEHQAVHRITSGGIGHKAKFVTVMTEREYRFHLADIIRMFSANAIAPGQCLVNTLPGRHATPEWVVGTISEMHGNSSEYVNDHIAGTVLCDAADRYGLRFVSTGLPLAAYKTSAELARQQSERLMTIIEKCRPSVLATSPNLLENAILPYMVRKSMTLESLGVSKVLSAGSALAPEILHALESQGADVVSWLESGEVCTIAYNAPEGRSRLLPTHFTNLFEIVDENGKHVPLGQKGRILATRLLTATQPLIRFDLEDEASFVTHLGRIFFDSNYGRVSKS